MKIRNNIALSAGLLTVCSVLTVASAAQAQNLSNFLGNMLGNRNNNTYNQTQNGPSADQSQTMSNLNMKRSQLADRISQAVANGQMSSQQGNDLRAQLNSSANLQNTYASDGNFTFAEAQGLLNTLSNIDASIQSTVNVSTTNQTYPTTYGGYFGNGNRGNSGWNRNNSDNFNNLDRMQSDVLVRLQQGQSNGQLTAGEYNNLKSEYDRIATREAQLRASGGRFSMQERSNMASRLNRLNVSITQQLHD